MPSSPFAPCPFLQQEELGRDAEVAKPPLEREASSRHRPFQTNATRFRLVAWDHRAALILEEN